MKKESPQCAKCGVGRCLSHKDVEVPPFCPTQNYPDLVRKSLEINKQPQNLAIHKAWRTMMRKVVNPEKGREKWSWTRVEEIIEYARIRGMKKIGIGTCYGLLFESRLLTNILEQNGFEVVSVSCLCGELNPDDVGIEGSVLCNPIIQAEILNSEKTELNIMVGLCLGHDIMFLRHCEAETTPLVVKDRALGHNPVAALYMSQGYNKSRFIQV